MTLSIYLSTGERSGEQHGADLARELLRQAPEAKISGMGGQILGQAGVHCIADPSAVAVTGFTEVLCNLGTYRRLLGEAEAHILETDPGVVVLVDYPGFHMRLAKRLRRRRPDQRIVYYISPKFWAWNRRRLRAMARLLDEVLCIFPFEPPMLREAGIEATFVGNPLLDQLDLEATGESLREELGLEGSTPLLGLFPGSRGGEIERLLPVFLETASRLREEIPALAVAIATPSGLDREALRRRAGVANLPCPVLEGRSHDLMRASRAVLVKSGTTTLEAALLGTPMAVAYRSSRLTAFLARRLARVKHFALPNLLTADFPPEGADSFEAVPERYQEAASPERLAAALRPLLLPGEAAAKMRQTLLALRERLGGPGAARRAAARILEGLTPAEDKP
jgi:lipid-A-disaccharide synthase